MKTWGFELVGGPGDGAVAHMPLSESSGLPPAHYLWVSASGTRYYYLYRDGRYRLDAVKPRIDEFKK